MSELVIADKSDLVAIADAIREKAGTTDGMGLGEMVEAINSIKTESPYNEVENNSNGLTITIG